MRRYALIAAAALMTSACHIGGDTKERDAGPETTRNFAVGAFEGIEVAGTYDVKVVTGDKPAVTATGGASLLDETDVVVEDGILKIRPKKQNGFRWNWHGGTAHFTVTTAALHSLSLAGSGDIDIDKVSGDFSGDLAGAGKLRLGSVDAGTLKLSIAGSGDVSAAGKANAIDLNIAGSGDINMKQVTAKTADISIAGSGNVMSTVSHTAKVSIAGSGNVDIGGGAKCEVSKFGSGNVRCQ